MRKRRKKWWWRPWRLHMSHFLLKQFLAILCLVIWAFSRLGCRRRFLPQHSHYSTSILYWLSVELCCVCANRIYIYIDYMYIEWVRRLVAAYLMLEIHSSFFLYVCIWFSFSHRPTTAATIPANCGCGVGGVALRVFKVFYFFLFGWRFFVEIFLYSSIIKVKQSFQRKFLRLPRIILLFSQEKEILLICKKIFMFYVCMRWRN